MGVLVSNAQAPDDDDKVECGNPKCSGAELPPTMKSCGRCRKQSYCSKQCQTSHWKEHKRNCKPSKDSNPNTPAAKGKGKSPSSSSPTADERTDPSADFYVQQTPTPSPDTILKCSKPTCLNRAFHADMTCCLGCGDHHYCSQSCKRSHWSEHHKAACPGKGGPWTQRMTAVLREEYILWDLIQRAIIELLGEEKARIRMKSHVVVLKLEACPLESNALYSPSHRGERILQVARIDLKTRASFGHLFEIACELAVEHTKATYPWPQELLGVVPLFVETLDGRDTLPSGCGLHKRLLCEVQMADRIAKCAGMQDLGVLPNQLPDGVWTRKMGIKARLELINSLIRSERLKKSFIVEE